MCLDFAARLRVQQPALRRRLRQRDLLAAFLKRVNATLEPPKVADAILDEFARWVPAPCSAVVVSQLSAPPALFAGRAMAEGLEPVFAAITVWVMRHGDILGTADLAADARFPAAFGSVLAVPLAGRYALGAIVAFDPVPAERAPRLAARIDQAMRDVLEPAAVVLENALLVQRAEALSITDDLTGLYNIRYLNQVLRRESKRTARTGRPLSLLFIDLDGFKGINDRYGHLAGSRALVETGDLLRNSARETDVVARFGGDEFALVLPETNTPGAQLVARRIRERIADHRFLAADGLDIHLTASVGVATLPQVATTSEELMRSADTAMYRVKERGKNGIEVAIALE